jgi:putative tricarboxylic transport membrane protein
MTSTFANLMGGFETALLPFNLLMALVGTLLGTAIGVLPGIGPALTIALLLPVTFQLAPETAFIMFAGILYGAMYGGSTTSILLNTPGESSSIVTAIEGNRMARNGRGAAALATAAIGSFVAGTIGTRLYLRTDRIFCADGSGLHHYLGGDGHVPHARLHFAPAGTCALRDRH